MTLEEYFRATRAIHEELAQIATRTAAMAGVSSADTTNPEFAGLMSRHSGLVAQFREAHARFIAENPQYA